MIDLRENFPSLKRQKNRIVGIASVANRTNKNGRIYPLSELQRESRRIQNDINSGIPVLMSLDHPSDINTNLTNACAKLEKVFMRDSIMYFEAKLLDTTNGNNLRSLLDQGIQLGVSTRGTGDLIGNTVSDFRLLTIDVVTNPSETETSLALTEKAESNPYNILESVWDDIPNLVDKQIEIAIDGFLLSLGKAHLEKMKEKSLEEKLIHYCINSEREDNVFNEFDANFIPNKRRSISRKLNNGRIQRKRDFNKLMISKFNLSKNKRSK